jgi:hypothetical protein
MAGAYHRLVQRTEYESHINALFGPLAQLAPGNRMFYLFVTIGRPALYSFCRHK